MAAATPHLPQPDNTAVRTALWRALHVQVDGEPYVIRDETGLKLIAPEDGWQKRPDMHVEFTKRLRASMVARARFIEDLVLAESSKGVGQYVILGAGLDTFAQRQPEVASKLRVYEIDQPGTQTWKRQRLEELGFGIPEWLHFVPVNFETSSWWQQLSAAGFRRSEPAVVACTGVTLYLTREAIVGTLEKLATLAPGSTAAITFYLPVELMAEEDKALQLIADKGAREAGTPFISFFSPDEVREMAARAGFREIRIVTTEDLEREYFSNRTDNLSPASGEMFLVVTT